jgi:hypothetical protein
MKRLNLQTKPTHLTAEELSESALDLYSKMKLIEAMETGMDLTDAAAMEGIGQFKLDSFRSDPDFEEIVQKCQAKCEFEHITNIKLAGQMGQWQASAWFLERKFPKKYGKKDTIRHEYEVKISSFMSAVLQVVNNADPGLKKLVLQELRQIDIDRAIDIAESKQIELKDAG